MPACLTFALAALSVSYKTGTPNDDKEVIDFIKKSSITEILSNIELWDDNLIYLREMTEKYLLMIEKNGVKAALKSVMMKGITE